MRFYLLIFCTFIILNAQEYENLNLQEAIKIVKKQNLEIAISKTNEKINEFSIKIAKGYKYGELNFSQTIINSNDAGNIFGFKLQNRKASFKDFGFNQFSTTDPNVLNIRPEDLNYPDKRFFYQQKINYNLALYTGGKLNNYEDIQKSLKILSSLNKDKIVSQKVYEVKKSFYDISLLDNFYKNLNIIKKNIEKLEYTVNAMIEEGYAKNIDLLEVQAKKANIVRMINQVESNRELAYQFLSFLLDSNVKSIMVGYDIPPMCSISFNKAIDRNIDIKKAKLELGISKKMIDIEQANFKPKINLFTEYQASDDNLLMDYGNNSYSVGVQLKFNLFNGHITKNKIEKAKVQNLQAQQRFLLKQKLVKLQISKILTEIKNFNFHIDNLKNEIKLSKTIYENYVGRYKEILVSINDVIIKQTQDIERVLKLKEIENTRNQKIFELEKIVNKGEIL